MLYEDSHECACRGPCILKLLGGTKVKLSVKLVLSVGKGMLPAILCLGVIQGILPVKLWLSVGKGYATCKTVAWVSKGLLPINYLLSNKSFLALVNVV